MVMLLSEAWTVSIALIVVFGIVFPALATGLIAFAAAQAMAERRENNERRAAHGRRLH
jgi:F0F1-type ATP synthase membrane subunit c/vacuolar-type H+-ATPase subunit K